MCRSLSILSYNVSNLKSKLCFSNFFSYINTFDIIFLYETHVTSDNRPIFLNYFRDFELYWIDAVKIRNAGRASGGCLFAFKKHLISSFSPMFCFEGDNVFLSVKINLKPVYFIPRYLNCNSWHTDFAAFESFLTNLCPVSFFILGDLNARVALAQNMDDNIFVNIPLLRHERRSRDNTIDPKGKKLLELFNNIGGSF